VLIEHTDALISNHNIEVNNITVIVTRIITLFPSNVLLATAIGKTPNFQTSAQKIAMQDAE
jgi:hypothetical protein